MKIYVYFIYDNSANEVEIKFVSFTKSKQEALVQLLEEIDFDVDKQLKKKLVSNDNSDRSMALLELLGKSEIRHHPLTEPSDHPKSTKHFVCFSAGLFMNTYSNELIKAMLAYGNSDQGRELQTHIRKRVLMIKNSSDMFDEIYKR